MNFLAEHDARKAAMHSGGGSTTMTTRAGGSEVKIPTDDSKFVRGFPPPPPSTDPGGHGEDQLGEGGGAGALGVHYRRWGSGVGGRGRNDKYENDKDNGKDRINVRRKVVDVGGVSEGLGTTWSDQQQRLPDNKDKDKDEDKRPSPPYSAPPPLIMDPKSACTAALSKLIFPMPSRVR